MDAFYLSIFTIKTSFTILVSDILPTPPDMTTRIPNRIIRMHKRPLYTRKRLNGILQGLT